MAARTQHAWSKRADGPFGAVNCAAIAHTLLESELFGHEKSAFTGATTQRRGRIELAAGGTFFLDEIAEMKPELLARLLRVIQERRFGRVGGSLSIEADVRSVASANRDVHRAPHALRQAEEVPRRTGPQRRPPAPLKPAEPSRGLTCTSLPANLTEPAHATTTDLPVAFRALTPTPQPENEMSAITNAVDAQASLEATIKGEVIRMYQEVAENPEQEFHFYHGHEAATMFGYDPAWLDRAPAGAVASFAGVGNPHERADIQPGETVLDLGSGAGLDGIIAGWHAGPAGKVIGLDLNPTMCIKAQAHAAESGTNIECREGRMEEIPLPDESVDIAISNGVINLSFQKRRVLQELFRVLRPGGRISITDIVSAKQLSQSIVNDPKLWAS